MDEFVAHRAAGPSPAEQGGIPIKTLLTDFALPRLDPKEQRLPISAAFPNTHRTGV
jgi:hypothetical protein